MDYDLTKTISVWLSFTYTCEGFEANKKTQANFAEINIKAQTKLNWDLLRRQTR